jgi:hypothetical protein
MAVFNAVTTIVLVAATLVTVWFARQAAGDGHKAAAAADTADAAERTATATVDTVSGLRRVATATGGTVEELERVAARLEQVADHARATVKLAREAAAADERDRKMRQLRDIAGLVETIFLKAAEKAGRTPTQWRCSEQNELGTAVSTYGEGLPVSLTLSGDSGPDAVMGRAAQARQEVRRAIETFGLDPA